MVSTRYELLEKREQSSVYGSDVMRQYSRLKPLRTRPHSINKPRCHDWQLLEARVSWGG